MDWRSYTFDEFLKARNIQVRNVQASSVDLLNMAMVACRHASGLRKASATQVHTLKAQLTALAAQGGQPDMADVKAIVQQLRGLGVKILDTPQIASSDICLAHLSESQIQALWDEYLETQQHFKVELAKALRHAREAYSR